MHANHAYVGAGLTATFTFNAANAAPFCKHDAALISVGADGLGFAQQGETNTISFRENGCFIGPSGNVIAVETAPTTNLLQSLVGRGQARSYTTGNMSALPSTAGSVRE